MPNQFQPEYIFESSWEVCNMVGGIYTVLSTKASTLYQQYGDKLVFIGPDVWCGKQNPYFEEKPDLYPDWKAYTSKTYNLSIRIGRWKIPGSPIAVLVDFYYLMMKKNEIFGHVWETSGVNSLMAYGDYDESSMFGYASGMVIESYYQFFGLKTNTPVVAHFNEWMTSFGVFYIREKLPAVATIFTTHATSIGRSIAGNNKPLYDYLNEYNGDQMAQELNMVSKHSTEKQAAHLADCFTTVSKITGLECEQLLDKKPDVITPNGFEDDFVPKGKKYNQKKEEARKLLKHVSEALLGYQLEENALFIGTAGRYEFKNKGIDVFIESLKRLNDRENASKQVVAFIMVPAWSKGHREDLANVLLHPDRKLHSSNRVTTHELHDYAYDNIIQLLEWFHLKNLKEDPVKIVFVPAYLNGFDGIFNKTYYDLLIGLDLTVFPSYYEPWGYTPLESVAFKVPTITTDLSGFGEWVSDVPQNIENGVGIIHRSDYNSHDVAFQIAEMIYQFAESDLTKTKRIRQKAAAFAEKALWKYFIQYYKEAYRVALKKCCSHKTCQDY
ncbi:MAG: glycosyltransferase [Paludibacter sp.]|nr:glycosyltransferase [Paludibacter sp.]MDD4198648.1 glycosyltransferase [Paludibacter sp.]MDD4428362.1 glycosyltransferase [Paludibacter sp.]